MPFDLLPDKGEEPNMLHSGSKLNGDSHALPHWEMPPRKRVRADTEEYTEEEEETNTSIKHRKYHEPLSEKNNHTKSTSSAKVDPGVTGPFMVEHVPTQYNPQGDPAVTMTQQPSDPNTKFCYRHRPDMLCRRQADEPTMDKLQRNLEKLSESNRQAVVQVWSLFSAAPSKHRNLMLQGILTQCCFPQLSFLSANVQKLIKIDFLSALPPELSFRILSSLDTISLCKAAQVSRQWRQLADNDVVWHRMCEQHIDRKCTKCGWGLPLLDRKRLRASKRQMQLRAAGKGMNVWSPASTPIAEVEQNPLAHEVTTTQAVLTTSATSGTARQPSLEPTLHDYEKQKRPWKHVYRDRWRVGRNWKHGVCSTKVLKGHDNGVMAVQILDNILATGSYDKTIKIWDLETGKEVRTLTGHTGGVRCLQFDDSKLISGSMDGTMKLWNWRTGDCLATYSGHTDYVIGLHFDSDILVSGSADHTAKVWNFQDKSTFTLRGHKDWVNSVRIDSESRTVFTASDDFTVKLWDLDTKQCIHTYKGHGAHVQQVVLLPREFDMEEELAQFGDQVSDAGSQAADSASFAGHIQSPVLCNRDLNNNEDQRAGAYRYTFENGRPEPPRYMLTSALDNTIRLWDVSTGREIRKFFGHVEGVWALAADSLRIVSGANDRMVKIWDPRTGKCERTFTGHTGPVTCIGLSDSRMCSAGEDNEVRVYCFKEKDCF